MYNYISFRNKNQSMSNIFTLKETRKLAKETAKVIKNGGKIYLVGELGGGKTTFTKFLAEELGINQFSIKSPTFTLIRSIKNLYHIDLYRLEGIDELLIQEINELAENPKNILIIEWADKLESFLPLPDIKITFKYINENSRKIEIITKN